MKRGTSWGYEITLTEKEDLLKVKILCAWGPLSIQNHPEKDELHIPFLGIECHDTVVRRKMLDNWRPGARVCEEEVMRESEVTRIKPGGRFIPAGLPHGLIRGKVLEISHQADTTHRLGRAMGRETHVEEFFRNWEMCGGEAEDKESLGARWEIGGYLVNEVSPAIEEYLVIDLLEETAFFTRRPEVWETRVLIPVRRERSERQMENKVTLKEEA